MIEDLSAEQKQKLYRAGEWLIAKRMPVAVITLLLTAVMAHFAFQNEMSTSFNDLLPYRHEYVKTHLEYAEQFGGANNITIMVEVTDGTIFNVDTMKKIFFMTQEVDKLPGVNHDQIDSIGHRSTRYLTMSGGSIATPPVMRREPKSDADVGRIREIVHTAGNIHGILVSLDDRAALIRANFHESAIDYRLLFDTINEKILEPFQDEKTKLWIAGEPRLYGWIYHYSSEVFGIFLGTTFFLWVLLYFYFKDWRGALRPTMTGVVSALWGLGLIKLMGFAIDPLSLVIPFFVTARAVSHSVQMHERYYEEYHRQNWNKEKAIVASFAELFVPTLSGIVTDALGMLVIIMVPVVILQRIAISASVWVATVALSELVLNPIVYYYLKPPEKEKVLARETGLFQRTVDSVSTAVASKKGRWVTVAVWVVSFVVALSQLQHLIIGDPTAASPLLFKDSPYNEAHTRTQEFFGGVEPLIIIAEGKEKGALKNPEVLQIMEGFQRAVDSDPEVGYSFSIADIIKSINMVFFDTQPSWGVIPSELGRVSNLFFFYFAGSPPSESAKYLDPSYTNAHVTFYCRNHRGETVTRIMDKCRDYIAANPSEHVNFRLAGGLIGVTAAANEEILRNDILMNILGFGTIFVIVVISYRSFVAGFCMMVPLLMANAVINAYMGFRNVGINLQSLPVVTVGVGFGIDYGLYIVSRAVEEFRVTGSIQEAVRRALSTSGKAVIFTAISLALATLAWAFSNIRFNSEMGLLLFLWMTISFLASVTLLPAILIIARPKFVIGDNPAEPEGGYVPAN